jgi:Holliday junction resolvasome RuvABC endonuclease subunit
MKVVTVMALDVAFANMGVAIMTPKKDKWVALHTETISTKPDKRKAEVRSANESIRRSQEIYRRLTELKEQFKPVGITAEIPTGGSKSSRAARAMGMSVALVAAFALDMPAEWSTPEEGKRAMCNTANASKAAMKAAASELYPESTRGYHKKRGKDEWDDKYEHVADALASFEACKHGNVCSMAKTLGNYDS